ncbi:mechanosensitive ion channel family protein [Phyllobacterium sp. LjRoot231]|uniref:mechanosensitive ion channel family protein n=1 Tax=Phyllobacterium sp. LjRoot231 TaxID=3342289 RepID=UPI003ECFDD17
MNPAMPNSLVTVLELAAILILLTATIGALLSVFITKRSGLIHLGLQLSLLLFMLYISQSWVYPLVFSPIFASLQQFSRTTATLCIMSSAFGINMMLKIYVWEGRLFQHEGASVPQLLVALVQGMIYLVAVLVILQFVYGQSITALATLSGAAAVVLGFSAQSTLGEMFAGIAISISKPFKVGDWIKVGDRDEGQVIDQTWRHVQIRTRDRCVLNIPNRAIADAPIKNFSSALGRGIKIIETIQLDPEMDRAVVTMSIHDAIVKTHGVLEDPAPTVYFRGMKMGQAEYMFCYFVDDYAPQPARSERLWRAIAEALPDRRDEPLHLAGSG